MAEYAVPLLKRLQRLLQARGRERIAHLVVLLGILSGAASLGLLLELIGEIWFERAPGAFDLRFFHWLQSLRSPLLDGVFITITRLGNTPALVAVTVASGTLLLLSRRGLEALVLAGCFAGNMVTVVALKWLLQRSRPVPAVPLVPENNPAFPSAHASLSLVVYVFAAYLIAQQLGALRTRLAALCIGLGFALLIGVSRLYLGVHWLSDVLGGYALGGVWLALLLTTAELRRIAHPAPAPGDARCTSVKWGLFLLAPALILFLLLYALRCQAPS